MSTTYKLQLHAQAYLDQRLLDNLCERVVIVNTTEGWKNNELSVLTSTELDIHLLLILGPGSQNADIPYMNQIEKGETWSLWEYGFNQETHIYAFNEEKPINWSSVRYKGKNPTIVIGKVGLDRHQTGISFAASKSMNLRHAWSLADAQVKRWVNHKASFHWGLFTSDEGTWDTVCYVSPEFTYADCRPIRNDSGNCILYCRLSRHVPLETWDLPLSMQLRHTQFKDHVGVSDALLDQQLFVSSYGKIIRSNRVINILTQLNKRHSSGKRILWHTAKKWSDTSTWDLLFMWQLCFLQDDCIILTNRGDLLVNMTRFIL